MPAAGDYVDHLEWFQHSPGNPDGYGQKPDVYTTQGFLWCAVEDVAANRESKKESETQVTSATVRVRNFPAIAAGDYLDDWEVKTVVAGDNETVCEVEQ